MAESKLYQDSIRYPLPMPISADETDLEASETPTAAYVGNLGGAMGNVQVARTAITASTQVIDYFLIKDLPKVQSGTFLILTAGRVSVAKTVGAVTDTQLTSIHISKLRFSSGTTYAYTDLINYTTASLTAAASATVSQIDFFTTSDTEVQLADTSALYLKLVWDNLDESNTENLTYKLYMNESEMSYLDYRLVA